MHQRTDLASGVVNGHRLLVELIEPPAPVPPIVAINWPTAATVVAPRDLDQAVSAAIKVLTAASIELHALRVWKKL